MSSIRPLRLGTCTTYLIRGSEGFILVDAGNRKKGPRFRKRLKALGISPRAIRLVVVTHVHFDHVGSCFAIKLATGAAVAVHRSERRLLEQGTVAIPPGIAPLHRLTSYVGNRYKKFTQKMFRFPPCPADFEITHATSLKEFGIDGIILPTPGHTEGSLSVVLKDGKAFVGDLAANYFPFGIGHYMTPYGEDIPQILNNWEGLLKIGVKTFYPAHGFPIPSAKLLAALKRHRKTLHG